MKELKLLLRFFLIMLLPSVCLALFASFIITKNKEKPIRHALLNDLKSIEENTQHIKDGPHEYFKVAVGLKDKGEVSSLFEVSRLGVGFEITPPDMVPVPVLVYLLPSGELISNRPSQCFGLHK